jgi:hypothetical protein
MAEIRRYNLLRMGKYQYEVLPSELVALAARRDKERKDRLAMITRGWDRVIVIGCLACAAYLTDHVLWWVTR